MDFFSEQTASVGPEWVMIKGIVYPGREKEPYVPSGFGVRGALSYDLSKDLLRCHECGKWFESVASHLRMVHPSLSARDYKHKHWLRQSTSLVNRRIQAALSSACRPLAERRARELPADFATVTRSVGDQSHSRYEQRNLRGTCHAQILKRIADLVAAHGETPGSQVFAQAGIHLASLFDAFAVKSVPDLMEKLGHGKCAKRSGHGSSGGKQKYSDADLTESLRDFYVSRKRLPREPEFGHGMLPGYSVFTKRFGSIAQAYAEAGLTRVVLGQMYTRKTDSDLLQALRAFFNAEGRLPKITEFSSPALPFSQSLLRNRFGSTGAAMEQAGLMLTESDRRRYRQGRWNGRSPIGVSSGSFLLFAKQLHQVGMP
jgi:hypothetical protein